jgi:hypothetical protein
MQGELVVDLTSGDYQVKRVTDPGIIGPVDYGWARGHTRDCVAVPGSQDGRDGEDIDRTGDRLIELKICKWIAYFRRWRTRLMALLS